ncbi:Isopentenyl-diphosphate Delta-isomerase [Arthrobacter saudimassiliensis]|uniref:Isopentenyl-diphosphate Delta-isomerase n=1 Tax=Arthrobacter saudimassiliensis TaxID=1461584 RepID=A0A078MVU0_9MICC|nr:Isopentenyl-diphosphate Delta-isomerase [Arthrobacter saudimassiliensis]
MEHRSEQVVLVNPDGEVIGTHPKATVHTRDTPLHLAFSTHVFNSDGDILVTRRALSKLTWPGVWTNSFCGHPGPGEATEDAVHRRARQELGLEVDRLELRLPDFRYRAVDASGVVEHEICPVYTAVAAADPRPSADEVMEWRWADPQELVPAVRAAPWAFSPWLALQLPLLYPAG